MELIKLIDFIILNAAACFSSLILVLSLTKYKVNSLSKLIVSVFIIFCSQIIIVEIILGALGILSYKNVSIFIYSMLFILILVCGKKVLKNVKRAKTKGDYPGLFSALILFGPIILLLFAKAFNAALQIPFEYDSVAYHLPFVVQWLQTGTLNNLYYSAFAGPISYYPSNYELLNLWTFLPLHNDFFANLMNFPLFVLLGGVTWLIVRNFGVDKKTALISTAIPFYMPIFLHQAGLPLVDLFFVLLFATSIYFLQEILKANDEKEKNDANLLLFGLSIGLFMGTKYLGLVYGALIVLLLIGIALYQTKERKIKLLKSGAIMLMGILLTGSFFYIRNWIDSGNPLFPLDLNLFRINILAGYKGADVNQALINTSLLANINNFSEIKEKIVLFFYMTGPYGLIAIILPIFILLFSVCNFLYGKITRKMISKSEILTPLLFAMSLLVYFYLYVKAPYTYRDFPQNIRYAMPFLMLGILGTGYLVQKVSFLKQTFYIFTTIVFSYSFLFLIFSPPEKISYTDRFFLDFSVLWTYKAHLLLVIFSLLAVLYAFQLFYLRAKHKKLKFIGIILLLSFSFIGTSKFITFAYSEREKVREYWAESYFRSDHSWLNITKAAEWFNKNAPQAKIAYSGFNFHYHLYGRALSREVDYVNINECADCRYVDYKNSENSIREKPDYQHWLGNLKKKEKEYLVVNPTSTEGVRSYEFEWAQGNRAHFEKIFNVDDVYVYRIFYD